MLAAMTVGKAQAALKPEIAKTEGVTLVGPGGGGGFGGGGRGLRGGDFGGRGLSMRAVRGGDFGPKLAPSAAAFRCSTGAVTVPDLCTAARRNFRAFPAEQVQMISSTAFSDDFKHRRFDKFRRFAVYGVPYLYAYTSYGCDWLYRRAIVTGSPYWWNRYYACRDGYYY